MAPDRFLRVPSPFRMPEPEGVVFDPSFARRIGLRLVDLPCPVRRPDGGEDRSFRRGSAVGRHPSPAAWPLSWSTSGAQSDGGEEPRSSPLEFHLGSGVCEVPKASGGVGSPLGRRDLMCSTARRSEQERLEKAQRPRSYLEARKRGPSQQCEALREARPLFRVFEKSGGRCASSGSEDTQLFRHAVPQWHEVPSCSAAGVEKKIVVNLYGGEGRVAQAFAKRGYRSAVVDLAHDSKNDVLHAVTEGDFFRLLNSQLAAFLALEPVCSSWSAARRGPPHSRMPRRLRDRDHLWGLPGLPKNDRQHLLLGNKMVKQTLRFISAALANDIPGYVENPASSLLFKLTGFQRLVKSGKGFLVRCDFCQYGTPWRKPTIFFFWGRGADRILLKNCCSTRGHCSATGKRHLLLDGFSDKGVFKTRAAQVYPRNLAESLAEQVCAALK